VKIRLMTVENACVYTQVKAGQAQVFILPLCSAFNK